MLSVSRFHWSCASCTRGARMRFVIIVERRGVLKNWCLLQWEKCQYLSYKFVRLTFWKKKCIIFYLQNCWFLEWQEWPNDSKYIRNSGELVDKCWEVEVWNQCQLGLCWIKVKPLITSLSDSEQMVGPLDYIGFGRRSRKNGIAKSLKGYVVWTKSFLNYIDWKINVLVTTNWLTFIVKLKFSGVQSIGNEVKLLLVEDWFL